MVVLTGGAVVIGHKGFEEPGTHVEGVVVLGVDARSGQPGVFEPGRHGRVVDGVVISSEFVTGHPGLLSPGVQGNGLDGITMLGGFGEVGAGQSGFSDPGEHGNVDTVGFTGTKVRVGGGIVGVTGHSGLLEPGKQLGGLVTPDGLVIVVVGHPGLFDPG